MDETPAEKISICGTNIQNYIDFIKQHEKNNVIMQMVCLIFQEIVSKISLFSQLFVIVA